MLILRSSRRPAGALQKARHGFRYRDDGNFSVVDRRDDDIFAVLARLRASQWIEVVDVEQPVATVGRGRGPPHTPETS